MVPDWWIKECLDLFGVAENIKTSLVNSMKKWRVLLYARNSELGEVDIKQGTFQGDSLFSLVFVLALIPLSLILRMAKAAHGFSGSRVKFDHLLFMHDLKLHIRNEKELDPLVQTIHISSKDTGMEFWYRKVCNVSDTERKHCEISWYRVARW